MALDLKVGKRYNIGNLTSGKVMILTEIPQRPPELPRSAQDENRKFVGIFFGDGVNEPVLISSTGGVYRNGAASPSWNLTSEYREPEYSYINVYKDCPLGNANTTLEASLKAAQTYPLKAPSPNYLHTLKLDPQTGKTSVFTHKFEE